MRRAHFDVSFTLLVGLVALGAADGTARAASPPPKGKPVGPQARSACGDQCKDLVRKTRNCAPAGLSYGNHPSIEGRGLEFRHFKSEGGGALTFPPDAGTVLVSEPATGCSESTQLKVKIRKCTFETKEAYRCLVDVVSPGDGICFAVDRHGVPEQREQSTRDRGVVLVKGYWDEAGAWSQAPGTATLSCDASGGWDQAVAADGAVTACTQVWRYDPKHHHAELESCVRALTGDYCGDGIARTLEGTDLDIHDQQGNPMTCEQCAEKRAFEATWSKEGAVCVAHPRYGSAGVETCKKGLFGKPDSQGKQCRVNPPTEILSTRSRCNDCVDTTGFPTDVEHDCPMDLDPICNSSPCKAATARK